MITDEDKDAIQEIMDWFNFHRVHETVCALNWTWAGTGIPSPAKMRQEARRLLEEVAHTLNETTYKEYEISTGGFTAYGRISDDQPTKKYFRLVFQVEQWETIND